MKIGFASRHHQWHYIIVEYILTIEKFAGGLISVFTKITEVSHSKRKSDFYLTTAHCSLMTIAIANNGVSEIRPQSLAAVLDTKRT